MECVRFADNGHGVAQECLPRLFERFWREDQARSSQNGEGSGLGLYIAKCIIEAHGGTIRVKNDGGWSLRSPCPEGRTTAMAKLLLAEDDQAISMLERDYLEMEGYEITAVDNGQAAITEALKGEYDLILLDLMLPWRNGYDVCRLIRDRIDIPILMVTAVPSQ